MINTQFTWGQKVTWLLFESLVALTYYTPELDSVLIQHTDDNKKQENNIYLSTFLILFICLPSVWVLRLNEMSFGLNSSHVSSFIFHFYFITIQFHLIVRYLCVTIKSEMFQYFAFVAYILSSICKYISKYSISATPSPVLFFTCFFCFFFLYLSHCYNRIIYDCSHNEFVDIDVLFLSKFNIGYTGKWGAIHNFEIFKTFFLFLKRFSFNFNLSYIEEYWFYYMYNSIFAWFALD